MTRPTKEQAQRWAAQWRAAGPALARLRATEMQSVDLWRVAEELDEAFWARVHSEPEASTSGLIEQQRAFARARSR